MELLFSFYPFLFTFLLFLFLLLKFSHLPNTNNFANNRPPGPWKLPLIGNMHQMIGSLPHRSLASLAERYGPLMRLKLGELSIIIVSSAETAKEVMKNHDIAFASRPYLLAAHVIGYGSTDMAFAPYGNYWRQVRKFCTLDLLSPKRVESFRSLRDEEVSNLVKSVSAQAGSLINLSKMIFASSTSIIFKAAVGRECPDQKEFLSLVKETSEIAGGFSVADLFPSVKILSTITGLRHKVEDIHQRFDNILCNIIVAHQAKRVARKNGDGEEIEEDLVDVFLNVREEDNPEFQFTIDNIKAVVLDIFLGGSETSSTTTDWAISEMLKNSRVMKKAQAEVRRVCDKTGHVDETSLNELKYLKLVIKETMRLHPPLPLLLPRECRERCEIDGYEIPAKSKVIVNAWAISRDPKHWDDAESFVPERFEDSSIDYKGTHFEYIPFGAGRRMCPGMTFGLVNTELPLARLLYHFDWKLADGEKHEDMDMSEVFGASVSRKANLWVVPIPYHPSPEDRQKRTNDQS